ncbi:MAG TPA: GNAT family N-acetyltransferase [Haliscomenobacter sp.]|uniref:GNAT family N-acetyltransferase n=1 Tax=Haliscomenobacter sp. TaxID=2717303 RepID=UPI002C72F135|nr:GNAT family N-acetyltransferase [Haliscomenobacter sp.]HOY15726.1 GNAT family N-acetyltransferase [Haliscomenobacter sp.]HPH21633.1 GNAT family N-acetyltransferase [Haliscomenobacter sp.]
MATEIMQNIYLIREGTIAEVVGLSLLIPEFSAPYQEDEYTLRLQGVPSLILVAEHADRVVGFKVGYAKRAEIFYSWMGAVLPEYRQSGVAKALAQAQENWAKLHGFQFIQCKTRNRLKAMLHFALGNGFDIIGVEPRAVVGEHRILLQKSLEY